MEFLTTIWETYIGIDEFVGSGVGVLVVFLLIKEKILAWPLGALYVLISIAVLYDAQLYSNLVLHVFGFLPLNLYGWWTWYKGTDKSDELPVTRSNIWIYIAVGLVTVAGIFLLPAFYSQVEVWFSGRDSDFVFQRGVTDVVALIDDGVLMLSLSAMWMQAKKKLETWIVWFTVNVFSVGLYFTQGVYGYAFLYSIYLVMAVWGYFSWSQSMTESRTR